MRFRLTSLLLIVFVFGCTSTLAQAQEKKADPVELPKPAVVVVKEPEMVTIYLHYFFPNYCHGYYIGYTMTVPCQVPACDLKYYLQHGATTGAPAAHYGPAVMAPALATDH